ncbi:Zinc finger protein 541 [Lepeophtheirus salmonis]|uniref:Zinc finger protein 541 n=1 Tax=Lepeophtheirus salmonis TaxID=72036 RepID=A0A7R8H311_LEPSM|nr:Zinc finger protein 541 [Lepeophtheirus salmonis]CAF2838854.1 Zinc finger protein 541 [Lepeophtheirus salmonis]
MTCSMMGAEKSLRNFKSHPPLAQSAPLPHLPTPRRRISKKKNQRRINNNVIQLHAEKDDLNGTTISATVNVATLDLSDPESIHRHLSQLNDTVLKVIPTTPNNGNPHLIQQSQKTSTQQQRSSTNRRSSSGGKSSPQVCGICSKVFSNASALAKHRLTHSEERRYHCSICGKAFKRQDHLNGHLLTHRSTKPFACTVEGCGKSYCDARSLRRHKENHHPQAPETRNTSHSNNNSNNLLDSIKFSGKGLTPQQFQLIEQIIKESKEGAAAAAAIAAASSSTSGSPHIQTLNGHMRLHGGYYKKDAEGRRIPSLTEAALLQQQSLSEKNVGAAKRNSNVQMMHSPALDPPPATAANSPSKAVDSAISSPSLAFRSLPPPDTTKLLANLERKAAAIQQQQQHPRQSPVLQFQPQSELLINNNHISNSKKRRKNDQQTQMAFLPTTPLPPLAIPQS